MDHVTYNAAWSKTAPLRHQVSAAAYIPMPEWAYLMEQGTGKTKVLLDKAHALFLDNEIDALLVVAPNGVQDEWHDIEIPKHMAGAPAVKVWRAGMGKRATAEFEEFLKGNYHPVPCWDPADEKCPGRHLRVLLMHFEAFSTKRGANAAERFLKSGRVFFAVDESSFIKTYSVIRTRTIIRLGKLARYRAIATGTEVTNSPLDLYAQFQFLRPGFLGPTYTAFKARYAEWREVTLKDGHRFKELVRYRNIDELMAQVNRLAFRVSKKECTDLPPKVYQRRQLYLHEHAMGVYRELVKRTLVEFPDGGLLSSPHAMTRLLRLQQITGGFATLNDGRVLALRNAKLEALIEDIGTMRPGTKTIIWARFVPELKAITAALVAAYGANQVVRYWGEVPDDERTEAKRAFQNSDSHARFFVANQQCGAFGLTLHRAEYVLYYSNDFSYAHRVQSEDRAHRIGLDHSVVYVDYVAEGTVDVRCLQALQEYTDMAMKFKTLRELIT